MSPSEKSLYPEIDNLSNWRCYKEGMSEISKTNARIKILALKTMAFSTLLLCVGSYSFGCMALQDGIGEYQEDSKAPIIGHFSEWTLLSFFLFEFIWTVPHEVSLLGRQSKTHEIFHSYLNKEEISPEEQKELYEIYCAFISSNANTTRLIQISGLQKPVEPLQPDNSNISIDHNLKEFIKNFAEEEARLSFFKQFRKGWGALEKNSGFWTRALYKTAVIGGAFLLGVHLPNYALGIYWAAEQAFEDFGAGILPTIGGHSIEWSVEALGLIYAYYTILKEATNIGRAEIIAELFRAELEKHDVSSDEANRLLNEMRRHISSVPDGLLLRKSLANIFNTTTEEAAS